MAKLFLKFDQAVLKEVTLSQAVVTIGRLPDNVIQIDNLAVSGHHAKIYWDNDKYVIEDNNSLNGTYVNNVRVTRQSLKDGDTVIVGKHTLAFQNQFRDARPAEARPQPAKAPMPKLEQTVVLDTKGMKERLAGVSSTPEPSSSQPLSIVPRLQPNTAPSPAQQASASVAVTEKIGVLNVIDGKTDQPEYLLTSKMNVIGKSDMASIKLKGWFAPRMAALISKRETGYFIAASEKKIKVKINGEEITGQKMLSDGDTVEVAGVTMTFGFRE